MSLRSNGTLARLTLAVEGARGAPRRRTATHGFDQLAAHGGRVQFFADEDAQVSSFLLFFIIFYYFSILNFLLAGRRRRRRRAVVHAPPGHALGAAQRVNHALSHVLLAGLRGRALPAAARSSAAAAHPRCVV